METIDAAIERCGAVPELIRVRANMGVEMGALGTTQKSIDGNGVFSSKDKGLPFDEEQFKKENYKAALNDLSFLIEDHPERHSERYQVAYLHHILGNFEKSNESLAELRDVKEYRNDALMGMTNNYIAMKRFDSAEKILSEMEQMNPKAPSIQAQFVNLYAANGNIDRLRDHEKKLQFYGTAPPFTDLDFTEENYKLVSLFADKGNKRDAEKKRKFEQIVNGPNKELGIDICVTILAVHPHGAELETMASNALIHYGKDAVPKTIQLFQAEGLSTCTTTIAADVLATIKDERGWQPLVDYLPRMRNLPFTLIPPAVPEKMMKFDKDRAIKILLPFIRDMLRIDQEVAGAKNPGEAMGKSMVYFNFCYPFRSFDKAELLKLARENEYTDEEAQALVAMATPKTGNESEEPNPLPNEAD